MNQASGKRVEWIDYARISAILCVILCHAVESCYRPVILGEQRIGILPWIVENTLFTAGRLGVPVFLCISGALLLGKEKDVFHFYRKSVLPILITTEIWIVLDYFFACIVKDISFSPVELAEEVLFLKDSELSHMWYMPMIIGIYLVIPFLSKLVNQYEDSRVFAVPLLLVFVGSVLLPTLNVFLDGQVLDADELALKIGTSFNGGVYGLYLLMGYFIGRRKILQRVRTVWLLAVAAFMFVSNSAGQYFLYSHSLFDSDRLLWYTSVPVFVMGLILFELIRRGQRHIRKFVRFNTAFLAQCSFGIYLIHKPVMELCTEYLPLDRLNVMLRIIFLFAAGLFVGFAVVAAFRMKGGKAGRLLFLLK